MPYDSAGNFSLVPSYKAESGNTIRTEQHNPPLEDIAGGLSNVLVRDGRNGMVGDLGMGSHLITNLRDGINPQDAVTMTQLTAAIAKLATPPAELGYFMRKAAPAGWVEANGGTIGSSSSGASTRANADTIDLFTALWTDFSDTELPILTSAGAASTRGSTAALDFAANKRLTIHNLQGEFLRGWDNGRGVDTGRTLGSSQGDAFKSHTHTGTTSSTGTHSHDLNGVTAFGGTASLAVWGNGNRNDGGTVTKPAGDHAHTFTTEATGDTETRPRNVAALVCLKL